MVVHFKKLRPVLLTILLGGFFTQACQSVSPPGNADVITLGESQNGSQLTLRNGDQLVLQLPTQPGTGYGWQVLKLPDKLLRLRDEAVEAPVLHQAEPRVGVEQLHVFRFETLATGQGELLLGYRRAWERTPEDLKRFSLEIVVR